MWMTRTAWLAWANFTGFIAGLFFVVLICLGLVWLMGMPLFTTAAVLRWWLQATTLAMVAFALLTVVLVTAAES